MQGSKTSKANHRDRSQSSVTSESGQGQEGTQGRFEVPLMFLDLGAGEMSLSCTLVIHGPFYTLAIVEN